MAKLIDHSFLVDLKVRDYTPFLWHELLKALLRDSGIPGLTVTSLTKSPLEQLHLTLDFRHFPENFVFLESYYSLNWPAV